MVNGLQIVTFGGLTIQVGDKTVTELASRKAELLLVYLAVQKRGYVRETLAGIGIRSDYKGGFHRSSSSR